MGSVFNVDGVTVPGSAPGSAAGSAPGSAPGSAAERVDGGVRPWQFRRRQRILQAASSLFAEQAFSKVHVAEVARRAGIGKPTVYRYFPSKDALFLAVVDAALAGLEREFDTILSGDIAAPQALTAMLAALGAVLVDQLRNLRVLDGENADLARRWRSTYRSRRQGIFAGMRRVIEAGIASGDFRAVDPAVVPGLLIGMVRGGFAGAPDLARERVVRAAVDLVLGGALAGPLAGPLADSLPAAAGLPAPEAPRTEPETAEARRPDQPTGAGGNGSTPPRR